MSAARKQQRNIVRQIAVQRRNLVAVCRLAVKSLIERSCFEPVEDGGEELYNFCAIMEHIFMHRLKPHQTWYGAEEPRPFWDYIRFTCRDIPHNCVPSIEAVENPKTLRGKGRAWLRTALMEKKLHDYFTHALHQTRVTKAYYSEGALLLSEDCNMISGILLGLNAIDFSFDIRGENLDQPGIPVIDFTPYLKFDQLRDFLNDEHRELRDLGRLMSLSLDSDVFIDENSDTWRGRYLKVDSKFRVCAEQKGYMEELVRLREAQLEEDHRQRSKLLDTLHHFEAESRRERQQLEAVIIELQAQLCHVKEEHRLKLQQMQTLLHRYTSQPPTFNPPEIALRDMAALPLVNPNLPNWPPPSDNELSVVMTIPLLPTSRPAMADTKSIISATSTVSATSRHETQSMVPLTGSLTSHSSYLAGGDLPPMASDVAAPGPEMATQADLDTRAAANGSAAGAPLPAVAPGDGEWADSPAATRRRISGSASAYGSPIIRQGHVSEDQDPSETDGSEETVAGGGPQKAGLQQHQQQHRQQFVCIPPQTPHEDTNHTNDTNDDTVINMAAGDGADVAAAPKPDLVTSCDSTFESSESFNRESESFDDENVYKQRSADDVETIPEDDEVTSSCSDLKPLDAGVPPALDEEEQVGAN